MTCLPEEQLRLSTRLLLVSIVELNSWLPGNHAIALMFIKNIPRGIPFVGPPIKALHLKAQCMFRRLLASYVNLDLGGLLPQGTSAIPQPYSLPATCKQNQCRRLFGPGAQKYRHSYLFRGDASQPARKWILARRWTSPKWPSILRTRPPYSRQVSGCYWSPSACVVLSAPNHEYRCFGRRLLMARLDVDPWTWRWYLFMFLLVDFPKCILRIVLLHHCALLVFSRTLNLAASNFKLLGSEAHTETLRTASPQCMTRYILALPELTNNSVFNQSLSPSQVST